MPLSLAPFLMVPNHLDPFLIVKAVIMGAAVAGQADVRAGHTGHGVALGGGDMQATGAMAGLAADPAPIFSDGEGLGRLFHVDSGDMTGQATLVELLFVLLQGRVGRGVPGFLPCGHLRGVARGATPRT